MRKNRAYRFAIYLAQVILVEDPWLQQTNRILRARLRFSRYFAHLEESIRGSDGASKPPPRPDRFIGDFYVCWERQHSLDDNLNDLGWCAIESCDR